MKMKRIIVALALVAITIGLPGCTLCACPLFSRRQTSTPGLGGISAAPTPQAALVTGTSIEEQTLVGIYQHAIQGVVNIRVIKRMNSSTLGLPIPQGQAEQDLYEEGVGSGFVVDREGHIGTNY